MGRVGVELGGGGGVGVGGVGRTGEGSTAEVNLEVTTVISNHGCPSLRGGSTTDKRRPADRRPTTSRWRWRWGWGWG